MSLMGFVFTASMVYFAFKIYHAFERYYREVYVAFDCGDEVCMKQFDMLDESGGHYVKKDDINTSYTRLYIHKTDVYSIPNKLGKCKDASNILGVYVSKNKNVPPPMTFIEHLKSYLVALITFIIVGTIVSASPTIALSILVVCVFVWYLLDKNPRYVYDPVTKQKVRYKTLSKEEKEATKYIDVFQGQYNTRVEYY